MSQDIEVFVRSKPESLGRRLMCALVLWRLSLETGIRVVEIGPKDALEPFAWTSRALADKLAKGPYFLLDDDTMPVGRKGWFQDFDRMCRDDGRFALVSARRALAVEDVMRWGPFPIEEARCGIGAPYWQRKGAIPYAELAREVPKASTQDGAVYEWLSANGLKTGVARDFKVNHIGAGYSQVEPKMFLNY